MYIRISLSLSIYIYVYNTNHDNITSCSSRTGHRAGAPGGWRCDEHAARRRVIDARTTKIEDTLPP